MSCIDTYSQTLLNHRRDYQKKVCKKQEDFRVKITYWI